MEQIELKVNVRATRGKGAARKSRAANHIPGIFYGPKVESPVSIEADSHAYELARQKAGLNTIYKLADSSGTLQGKLALLKVEQKDPVKENCIHFDLYEVRAGEPIKVKVPVHFTGKAKGTVDGGLVQQITRVLPIRCLPKDIPDAIEVDITELGLNESLHVNDIKLPEGVKVAGNVNYTLVSVVLPEKEETKAAVAADAAAPAAAAATPAASKAEPKK